MEENPYAPPKAGLGTDKPVEGPLAARRRASLQMEVAMRALGGTMVVFSVIAGLGALIAYQATWHWGPGITLAYFATAAFVGFHLERLQGPARGGALAVCAVAILGVLAITCGHGGPRWLWRFAWLAATPALTMTFLASSGARKVCSADHRALVLATPEVKPRPSLALWFGLFFYWQFAIISVIMAMK